MFQKQNIIKGLSHIKKGKIFSRTYADDTSLTFASADLNRISDRFNHDLDRVFI